MDQADLWRQHGWIGHTQVLLDSFRHWLNRELIPRGDSPEADARALFEAALVVVSHGTQADPLLTYGNRRALELWELDAETFLRTPSRLTAEPMHRDERAQLLARTARDGYADDYRGIRISRTGKRFFIENVIVWNLLDRDGHRVGQAAMFSQWRPLANGPNEG